MTPNRIASSLFAFFLRGQHLYLPQPPPHRSIASPSALNILHCLGSRAERHAYYKVPPLYATTHVQHLALAQHEEHRLLCLYPSKNGNKVWKVTVEGSNDAKQTAEEIQQQAEVQTPEEEPKPKAKRGRKPKKLVEEAAA